MTWQVVLLAAGAFCLTQTAENWEIKQASAILTGVKDIYEGYFDVAESTIRVFRAILCALLFAVVMLFAGLWDIVDSQDTGGGPAPYPVLVSNFSD